MSTTPVLTQSSNMKKKKVYQPADTKHLVAAISSLRESLHLSPCKNMLKWKEQVPQFMNDSIDQAEFPYAIISRMYFQDSFKGESLDIIFDRWLNDQGKRAVLFAPGNYSYINIEPESQKIVVIFLYILHPK